MLGRALEYWIRFEQPWWLLSAALAGLPALAAWGGFRRGRRTAPLNVALQTVAVLSLAVALARPAARVEHGAERPWLVVRDASASVRGQNAVLPWPEGVTRETMWFSEGLYDRPESAAGSPTNAAAALRLAAARAEGLAGVLFLTDGQFHDEWSRAAAELGRSKLDVLVVPLDSAPPDLRVAGLEAGRRRGSRAGIELRITIEGRTRDGVVLRVRRGLPTPADVLVKPLSTDPDVPVTLPAIDSEAPTERACVYTAELIGGGDAFPENDRRSALVLPEDVAVAWIAASARPPAALAARLSEQRIVVRSVEPRNAPTTAAGWGDFGAVILVDPLGTVLPKSARAALARAVRSGNGLVQVGAGPRRSPADLDDPLNRIAALVANPYERRPLKVVVVLDASGSMGEPPAGGEAGRVRFDLAVEAIMALERHLTRSDSLAVLTFANAPRLVYDSAGPPDFGRLHHALRAVRPGGPTDVLPALERAVEVETGEGRDGLLLLVSDLLSKPFDPERAAGLFDGRRLAIILTQPGEEEGEQASLRKLAELVNVAPRPAEDLSALAGIFVELLSEARGPDIRGGPFEIRAPDPVLFGVPAARLPRVPAYIPASPREGAEVLARAESEPILAVCRAGLGTVVTLAAAGEDKGAGELPAGLSELLAAAASSVLRRGGSPGFEGQVLRGQDAVRVVVTAYDPSRLPEEWPKDGLSLTAEVMTADADAARKAAMLQIAPGGYEAVFSEAGGAAYVVVRDAGGRPVWRGSLGEGYPREYERLGADRKALRRLAELTGGRVASPEAAGRAVARRRSRAYRSGWPYLVAFGLLAALLDWAFARIRRMH